LEFILFFSNHNNNNKKKDSKQKKKIIMTSRGTLLLPQSYKNVYFPETDAYENLLYLYPLTSGSFTVGQ
jgi:hypothetical protein